MVSTGAFVRPISKLQLNTLHKKDSLKYKC